MPEFRALLSGGGEMGERIRTHDWAATPLGPPKGWPQSLRSALSICLHSSQATAIYWGADLRIFHNDAWRMLPGRAELDALGRPAEELWADFWHILGPKYRSVFETGRGFSTIEERLPMRRGGRIEDTFWDYSVSPIASEDGSVGGIITMGQEATARVFARKRDALLLDINAALRPLDTAHAMTVAAVDLLGAALNVSRVGYCEIDEAVTTFRIEHAWQRPGERDLRGSFPIGHFGSRLHEAPRAGETFRMDDAREMPGIVDTDLAAIYESIGARAGIVVPVFVEGRYAAAIFAHDARPHAWTHHHENLLAAVAETIRHDVARVRAETAMRDSEQRFRLIFEQAHDIIFTADLQQTITAANPASLAALGLGEDAVVGHSIAEFVSDEDFKRTGAMLREKLAQGGTTQYEVDVIAPDHAPMRWEINSTLAVDRDGKAIGLHAIARDVTERRAFEERRTLLIHELNHRVKNTLALVQGLALQSFRPDKSPDDARNAFQARLTTLAAAHDLLTARAVGKRDAGRADRRRHPPACRSGGTHHGRRTAGDAQSEGGGVDGPRDP